jgi:hypothetical protein
MPNRSKLVGVVTFAMLIGACGAEPTTATCVPGRTEACACVDGTMGAQECTEDGRFGECRCAEPPDSGLPVDAGTTHDSGGPAVDGGRDDGGVRDEDASVPTDGGTAPRGHAVLIGHNYQQPHDELDRILANALFLSERAGATLRVLEYTEYSEGSGLQDHARSVIDSAGTGRGRSVTRTSLTTAAGLTTALATADVLFVPLQPYSNEAQMRTVAGFWREPMSAFLDAGGVVVVATSGTGTGSGYEWVLLDAADLFSLSGGRSQMCCTPAPIVLEIPMPSLPIAAGVLTPFSAERNNTSLFPSSARGTVVVRTADTLVPVVRHLVR